MVDIGSIAKVVHDIDLGIQEMGGDSLTPVQQQLVFVNAAVAEQKLGKSPEELVSKTLASYEGNVIEAARGTCSQGKRLAA